MSDIVKRLRHPKNVFLLTADGDQEGRALFYEAATEIEYMQGLLLRWMQDAPIAQQETVDLTLHFLKGIE